MVLKISKLDSFYLTPQCNLHPWVDFVFKFLLENSTTFEIVELLFVDQKPFAAKNNTH